MMNLQILNGYSVLWVLLIVAAIVLGSCKISVRRESGNKTADQLNAVLKSDNRIRNQIQWEGGGDLQLEAAFLMSEDGHLIDDNNEVEPGNRIRLILKLSGWILDQGKVNIGVGQQLTNSDGKLLTRTDDIFENSGPFLGEDAKILTLSMEVLNTTTIYPYYNAQFKVWNKNQQQYVRGGYTFKLKQ